MGYEAKKTEHAGPKRRTRSRPKQYKRRGTGCRGGGGGGAGAAERRGRLYCFVTKIATAAAKSAIEQQRMVVRFPHLRKYDMKPGTGGRSRRNATSMITSAIVAITAMLL